MSLYRYGFKRVSRPTLEQVNNNIEAGHLPSTAESGLGAAEHNQVCEAVVELADPSPAKKRRLRGSYTHYSPKDRALIGRYALENGNENARKHFSSKFPSLSESTVRNFRKAYKEKLSRQQKQACPQQVTEIPHKPRGRPPLLLELDEKLIKFLRAVRSKGGIVNIHVVRATATALIESNPSMASHLNQFSMPRTWVTSLYRRMGFVKRKGTTTRPPVTQGLYDECRREYLTDIKTKVDRWKIPPELVINSDQTPSSYVSVGKSTMAASGTSSVPIKGLTDKRAITLNFVITLANAFLPMQIIYSGKTKASLPRGLTFPSGFSLTQNPKHWSNEQETLKLINEIISPYVVKTRQKLKLKADQKALLVWDVFRGQMTAKVKEVLNSLNIECTYVPANMTHFFQPLDLTVNRSAKSFMKKQFVMYYASAVRKQLQSGKQLEDIEVDFRLSSLKPLHARWLVSTYNFMTSDKGKEVIAKGWKKSGVFGLFDGTTVVPPEDPFETL